MLCPGCGATIDNSASTCHQCQRPLRARPKELPDAAPPGSPVPEPVSRRANRAIAGAVVLVVMAGLGYYIYTQLSVMLVVEGVERAVRNSQPPTQVAPAPPPTIGIGESSKGTVAAGAISRNAVADDATSVGMDESVPPVRPTAKPAEPVPAAPIEAVSVAANPQRAWGSAVESRQTQPLTQQACTEAMAALGLCATNARSLEEREARNVASDQKPRRRQGCTEGAAALGLCSP